MLLKPRCENIHGTEMQTLVDIEPWTVADLAIKKRSERHERLVKMQHRVVIVGGGFGGLFAARALNRVPVQITLIDRRNFHLFQPLLYQVAAGGLSPANIASPLRGVLSRQQNVEVHLSEVSGFDVINRQVLLKDGTRIGYDTLIVAAGAVPNYFGHDDWEAAAPALKSIADAREIRRRVLCAFESAELASDDENRRACLTFVVVGGGSTGVELAGCLSELAHETLKHDYRQWMWNYVTSNHSALLIPEESTADHISNECGV